MRRTCFQGRRRLLVPGNGRIRCVCHRMRLGHKDPWGSVERRWWRDVSLEFLHDEQAYPGTFGKAVEFVDGIVRLAAVSEP